MEQTGCGDRMMEDLHTENQDPGAVRSGNFPSVHPLSRRALYIPCTEATAGTSHGSQEVRLNGPSQATVFSPVIELILSIQ